MRINKQQLYQLITEELEAFLEDEKTLDYDEGDDPTGYLTGEPPKKIKKEEPKKYANQWDWMWDIPQKKTQYYTAMGTPVSDYFKGDPWLFPDKASEADIVDEMEDLSDLYSMRNPQLRPQAEGWGDPAVWNDWNEAYIDPSHRFHDEAKRALPVMDPTRHIYPAKWERMIRDSIDV